MIVWTVDITGASGQGRLSPLDTLHKPPPCRPPPTSNASHVKLS